MQPQEKQCIEQMIKSAKDALNHAYSPFSNFQVSCCIATTDGQLFTGVNVENSSFGLTLCAEASAIAMMVSSGQQHIARVLIMNGLGTECSPCGACRQRILEFSTPDTPIHLADHQQILKTFRLDALLPSAFTFKP